MGGNSKLEWFRLITPALAGMNLFLLSQIWMQLSDVSQKMYQHQINAEIHFPRSEIVSLKVHLNEQFKELRTQILDTIRSQKIK